MFRNVEPRPGDYVACHSLYYGDVLESELNKRFAMEAVYQTSSLVVPFLSDYMEDQSLQNRATAFRFRPQLFGSLVYRIEKQLNPKGESKL